MIKRIIILLLSLSVCACSLVSRPNITPGQNATDLKSISMRDAPLQASPGMDYLGGARYSQVIYSAHPKGWGAGFFSNVPGFGDSLPVVDGMLRRGLASFIRIQLAWSDSHSFSERDFPKIVADAKRWEVLALRYPNVKFYLSGACEHKLNATLATKLSQLVRAAAPHTTYVNSPLPQGALVAGVINEMHGGGRPRSVPCAFSYDGTAAEDSDNESDKSSFRQCQYFMWWGPRFNLNWSTNEKKPRDQRNGAPDATYIQAIAYLNQAKGSTGLPNKYLYKSHGENHGPSGGKPDPKGNKPVVIAPAKADAATLKTKSGRVVTTFRYYGPYKDGRSRYYGSDWGFRYADRAKQISGGDPTVDIFIGSKKVGAVNPAFREGEFR